MLSFKSICNCSRFGCSYDVSTGRRYCTGLTRTWRRRFSGGKMLWTLWSWAILEAHKSCISTEPGDFGAWGFQTKMAFDGRYTKIWVLSLLLERTPIPVSVTDRYICRQFVYMCSVLFYLSFKSASNVHDVFLFFMFLEGQQRHFHFTMPFVNLILHFFFVPSKNHSPSLKKTT